MKSIVPFLKKVLLVIELFFVILFVHWEKVLFVAIIALDQFLKMRIMDSMELGESIPIVQDFFKFTYVQNPGAAFGILPNQRVFFFIISILLLVMFAVFYPKIKKNERMLKLGAICLLSGAMANLIDRVRFGYVIDFFHIKIWPAIFNVADVAIMLGMSIMVYEVIHLEDGGKVEGVRR